MASQAGHSGSSRSSGSNTEGQGRSSESVRDYPSRYAGGWPGSIAFVGRLAMGRQVAAAAVMLVVVAVGLWYVPQLRQHPEAVDGALTHSGIAKSEPYSDRLRPAEPLDLAIDKRSGRIHPRGSEPPMVTVPRRASTVSTNKRTSFQALIAAAEVGGNFEPPRSQPNKASPTTVELDAAEPLTVVTAPITHISAANKRENAESESVAAVYDRAMVHFRGGNLEEAIKGLSQIADLSKPNRYQRKAFLFLGRSYRISGRCELAISQYQKLITRYPVTPEGGDGMLEAARCYRRMGDPEQANKLIERASQQRWLTPRARRELKKLGY